MDIDKTVPTGGTKVVGEFRLVRPLGAGGFGTVFEAVHLKTGLPYAIKRLHAEDPDRFEKEALYPAKAASHSLHVLNLHSFFQEADGAFYLVTDLIPHGDLGAYLKAHRPLSVAGALDIALGIAKGLAAIHEQGIVHLDLKPANVLMDRKDGDWIPKISDFGLARSSGSESMNQYGSAAYASPEHFDTRLTRGPCSDMFSFGMLLYELLTGRQACGDVTSVTEYAAWILRASPPEAPSKVRPELRGRTDFDDIIANLLQFDASRRTLTAADAVRRLADARQERRAEAPDPVPPPEHRARPPAPETASKGTQRSWKTIGAVASMVVVLAAAAGVFLIDGKKVDASDGMTRFRAGAYGEALPILLDTAKAGSAEAQRALGEMYGKGLGVTANPAEARSWLDKAIRQDDAEARCVLADLYRDGAFGAPELAKARGLYAEAAKTQTCGHRGMGQLLVAAPRSGGSDFDDGLHHLEQAADGGDGVAAARIRDLQADWALEPLVPGAWQPVTSRERRDEIARVKAARVFEQFPLVDVRRLRRLPVEFYPGTTLFELEVADPRFGSGVVSYLGRADAVVPVNGRSEQIKRLNTSAPLQIETRQKAAAFLRFFQAGALQGRQGLMRIVEDSRELRWNTQKPDAVQASAGQRLQPLHLEPGPSGGWLADATVAYGGGLLKASFWLKPDGSIELTGREEIASQLPVFEEFFDPAGVRLRRAPGVAQR